jgi:hypothetical protein
MNKRLIGFVGGVLLALAVLTRPAAAQITDCSDCIFCPGETHYQI